METKITKCGMCGNLIKKNIRVCPVITMPLCSACCGNKRNSEIICSGSCSHNPFGYDNYDKFMQIFWSWSGKCIQQFSQYFSEETFNEKIFSTLEL